MTPAVKNPPDTKEKDKVEEQPPWFRVKSEHWTYIAKGIEGTFPNWKQVMPANTKNRTQVVLQPTGVDTILEALPLLPGGHEPSRPITLAAANGLVLQAKGKDQADWTQINVPDTSVVGKAVQVTLNRSFLLKAVRFGLHQIAIHLV